MASNKKSPTPKATPTTPSAASRIQSTQVSLRNPARIYEDADWILFIFKAKTGNETGKGTFPARVQSAAATNVNKGVVSEAPAATPTAKGGRKSPTKGTKK